MTISIRQEVPIKSFSIAAFIVKREQGGVKYLLLHRCGEYLNDNWQMVSGKVEKGETAWQAALREIKEETSIVPDEFYSCDILEQFYELNQNCINLVPIFVGFINSDQEVVLSDEHDEYKWVSLQEAKEMLEFHNQIVTINHINTYFVQRKPSKHLKIECQKTERKASFG